jgi:hypothetical protein
VSHDYQPSWDYPCIELQDIDGLSDSERAAIEQVIERAKAELAPAMGFGEGFEVFFAEALGLDADTREPSVAVYCNGTNSRPVVGFDLASMREVCKDEGLGLVHQFEVSLAHELGHAYQESCGFDHEHERGFDEDTAEEFGVLWADYRVIELWRLNPELPRPAPKTAAPRRMRP